MTIPLYSFNQMESVHITTKVWNIDFLRWQGVLDTT